MDALTFDDVPFERDTEEVAAEKVDYADVSRPSGEAPAQPKPTPALSFDDVPFEEAADPAPSDGLEYSNPMGDPAALDIVSSGVSAIRNWGVLTPEEAEAEKKERIERARQQKIWAEQQRADIEGRMGEDYIPGQTFQEEAAAKSEEVAKGPAPTLSPGRSATEGFIRETGRGIVSLAVAPGITVDFIDWATTGDTNESGYTKATRSYSDAIAKAFPGDPTRQGELIDQLAAGGGSLTSMLATGAGAKAIGLPAKFAQYYAGMSQSGVGGYEDAEANKATPGQKYTSFFLNAGLGATEAIPISRAFDRLNDASGGKVQQILANSAANSLEEFIQELGQGLGSNFIANTLAGYDKDRSTTEGVAQQAAVGLILGGVMGAGTTALYNPKDGPEVLDDKGVATEHKEALQSNTAPGAPADVDPAMAQAVAGKPVETPGEYAIRVARERAAAQAAAQPAPAAPAPTPPPAPGTAPMAPRKPAAPPVEPTNSTGNQPAAPPSADAGQEPSATVGVAPTAPPPSQPSAPAPANDLAERAAAAIQESGVTSPYWLGRMLGVSANQAGDVMLQLAQNKRLLEFKNNKFKMLPATSASNPDANTLQETEATLAEQQKALVEGKRRTVFYPEGTKPATPPPGSKRTKIEGVGIFDYMSDKITPQEIRAAAKAGRLNDLLDMGPFNKQQVAASASAGAAPVAVTERTPGGTEVKAATGTTETAPAQQQVLEATKADPGNTVAVEDPNAVVAGRQKGRKLGNMLKPYPGEGYRLGPFSFDFNERNGGRYLRVRDRSGNNILQGTDGGEANVDVTDIWSSTDPNQYESRQGNKVGINSLENNVPPQMVGIVRDWLSGKIDKDEALARIANQDLDGGQAAAPSAPAAKAPVVETKKPRVLKDLSTDSVRAQQEQAEQNEIQADRIKGTLKGPANKKVFKEEADSKGKNWTKAQRESRAKLEAEGQRIAEANPPAANEDGFLDPNPGKQTVARAAIRARAEAIVQGAKAAGLSIPDKVSGNTDETMNLGQGAMQLVVARDFLKSLATPYKPVAEHYTDFVSRDLRLRNGLTEEVTAERRTEIDDKMRRSQGGDIEQIADTRQTVESDAPDNAAESLDGRDETLSAEQQAQVDDGKTASDTVGMQGDERIVGKDDVETKVSRTAKKPIILMDEERAAQVAPVKSVTAEEKQRIIDELRKSGYMREDGSSDAGPTRELTDEDVIDSYTLAEAIEEAGEAQGSGFNRSVVSRVLQQLGKVIGDTPVLIVDAATLNEIYPGRNVNGYYDPKNKRVIISTDFLKNGKFDANLLAHEGLHAYLADAINSDPNLKADIQEILDYVTDRAGKMKGARGLKDVDEFISEAFSNPRFQNFLMNTEVTGALASKYDAPGKKTLWSAMVAAVAKHLGYKGRKELDALSFTMRLAERAEMGRKGAKPSQTMFSETETQPVFYSAVQRVVENIKQGKAAAGQWFGMIKNAPGVKAEELEFLGLEDWLKAQDGPVTREKLLDFLRANELQVEEIENRGDVVASLRAKDHIPVSKWIEENVSNEGSGYNGLNDARWAHDEFIRSGDKYMLESLEKYGVPDELLAPYRMYADEMSRKPRWGSVTLPGGQNYKEILITLPGNAGDYYHSHWDGRRNVVAHIRFDERTDSAGSRVLFIQEVQSDWHQQARKRGYIDPAKYDQLEKVFGEKTAELEQKIEKLREDWRQAYYAEDDDAKALKIQERIDELQKPISLFDNEFDKSVYAITENPGPSPEEREVEANAIREEQAWVDKTLSQMAADRVYKRNSLVGTPGFFILEKGLKAYDKSLGQRLTETLARQKPVPDAPFKTTWPELMMKRLVRYAADNGFDKVAWASSPEQVAKTEKWDDAGFKKNNDRFYVGSGNPSGNKVDPTDLLNTYPLTDDAKKAIVSTDETGREYIQSGMFASGKDVTPIVKRYTTDMGRIADKLMKKSGVKTERTTFGTPPQIEYDGPYNFGEDEVNEILRSGDYPAGLESNLEELADYLANGYMFRDAINTINSNDLAVLFGGQMASMDGGNSFNSIAIPSELANVSQPLFRERNFGDELRNAGVPDDIAAELEGVLSGDLKDMDDATLAFVMDDLKAKYGTSESNDPTADQVNKAAGKQADAINKAAEKLQKDAEEFVPRKNPGKRRLLSVKSNYQIGVDSDDYFGQYSNPLRKIAEYIERRRVRKAEILQGLGKVVEKLSTAHDAYMSGKAVIRRNGQLLKASKALQKKTWEDFASLMNDATMAEVHPDRALDQQKHLGNDTLRYKWAKAQHPNLSQRWENLPDDLKALWQETRDTYTDTQNEMNLGRLSNLLKLAGHPDPALAQRFFAKKATEADKKLIGPRVAELIDDTVELSKIEGPYFPLARRGEWRVQGVYKIEAPKNARKLSDNEFEFKSRDEAVAYAEKQDTKPTIKQVYVDKTTNEMFGIDKDGVEVKISKNDTDAEPRWRVTVQNRHVEFANSEKEAKKIADQLRADGLKEVDDVQPRTNDLPNGANADMLSEQMKQLASTLGKRKAFSDLSSTQQEELRQVLQEVSLRFLGSTRIQSHLIRRRYVEGASQDAVRNANDYVDAASGYIAKLEIQPDIDAAFKEGDRRLAVLGKQGTGAAAGAGLLVRELKRRAQSSNIDEANGVVDVAIRRLTQLAFLRYLASPAYSFFNAMQPNLVALPVLAAEYGEARAVIEMNVAYYDLGGPKMIGTGVVDTVKAFGGSEGTDHLMVASKKLKNPKEREMLEELRKIGFIDFDAGMMVARNLQYPDTVMGRTYDPAMAFIDNIGRQAPKAVEALNRTVVALTAYRLAMKKHGNHKNAIQDAKDAVDLTQGTYSQSNQAPVFRSKGGRIALQFKKFGQMMYYNLGRQAGRVIRGMKPGDRKAGFKALAYTLATHQIAAGTMGLPWEPAKVLMAVLNGFGAVEYDWEDFKEDVENFYKGLVGGTFAEMLTYGVSRGLGDLAFDMSGRVGLDSLIVYGSPKSYKEADVESYLWDLVSGASGSMVSSVAKAVTAASNGEWGKFLDALPLKFAVDVSKAVEKGATGDYTVPEAILKGSGLTPASQMREQRKGNLETKQNRRVKSEHDRLFYGYIDAGNDMGKIAKLKGQIREWNAAQEKLPKDKRGQKIRFETVEKRRREELREKAKNKSVDE